MKRFHAAVAAHALARRNAGGGAPAVVYITLPATNGGTQDAALIKYDATGTVLWAVPVRGVNTDTGYATATDSTGGVYLAGSYWSSSATIPLNNADGSTSSFSLPITIESTSCVYLIKYDAAGTVLWATAFSPSDGTYVALTATSTGAYLSARYSSVTHVIPIPNANGTVSGFSLPIQTDGVGAIFTVMYNGTTGAVVWAASAQLAGSGSMNQRRTCADSTSLYAVGYYSTTAPATLLNGDGTPSSLSLPIQTGNTDGYVIKYSLTTGAVQWRAVISGTGLEIVKAVAADSTGVYVGGTYDLDSVITLTNANDTPSGLTLTASPGTSMFVVKYNTLGVVQWRTGAIGTYGTINDITTDATGVYVVGFGATSGKDVLLNADSTTSSAFFYPTLGSAYSPFVLKYDANGNVLWASLISPSTNSTNQFQSVSVTATGIYATGQYLSTATTRLFNADGTDSGFTLPISAALTGFTVVYSTSGAIQQVTIAGVPLNSVAGYATGRYVSVKYTSATPISLSNAPLTSVTPIKTLQICTSLGASFLVKYTLAGASVWGAVIGPSCFYSTMSGIATDSTGIYASGTYSSTNTVDLSNANNLSSGKTLPTATNIPYLIKYTDAGVVSWAIPLRATATSGVQVVVSDSTNVYAVGSYTSPTVGDVALLNGDGSTSSFSLPTTSISRGHIIKYTTSGAVQWVASIGPTTSITQPAVALHSAGICTTGSYSSTSTVTLLNANGSDPGKTLPGPTTTTAAFVVNYSSAGVVLWAATINGTGADTGLGINTDSTAVYVSGSYTSTGAITLLNADGGASSFSLPFTAGTDAFLVKYDLTTGAVLWGAAIKGTSVDTGNAVGIDATGVYLAGSYRSTSAVTLLNADGSASSILLPLNTLSDGLIVKYNLTTGAVLWAATIVDSSTGQLYGIRVDATGVYVTGNYTAPTALATLRNGDRSLSSKTLPTTNGAMHTIKYDTAGTVQWALVLGQSSSSRGNSIATTSTNVYVGGNYNGGYGALLTDSF